MTIVSPNPLIALTPLTDVGARVVKASVVEPSLATPTARPHRDRRAAMLERRPANETRIARLRNHLYAHGAYLGLTRSFLQNRSWNHLLHVLTPDTAARVDATLQANDDMEGGNLTTLMTIVENNPVLAAYGTWRNGSTRLPIEWDIWLDPKDPANLDAARIIHGNRCAEAVAQSGAPQAALMTQESVSGSDVHMGVSPRAWRDAYDSAMASARTSGPMPRRRLPLYLDVKSSYSSGADIEAFARAAQRELKVEVRGVMSFKGAQLDGVDARHKVYLFDTPEEVAMAQAQGQMPSGAIAMFNGGFLLQATTKDADTWTIDPARFALLQAAQLAGNLRLTIYIQETVASPSALDTLFRFMNIAPRADNPRRRMFTLGPAYGNLNGRAERSRSGAGINMQFAPTLEGGTR